MQLPTSLNSNLQRLEQTLNRLSATSNPGKPDSSSVATFAKELSAIAESLLKESTSLVSDAKANNVDISVPTVAPETNVIAVTGPLGNQAPNATLVSEHQNQQGARDVPASMSAVDMVKAQNEAAGLTGSAYETWLQSKPEMTGSVAECSKSLEQWQRQNPRYIDPKQFSTFDGYLGSVSRSEIPSVSTGRGDPETMKSHLLSYFGPVALANPWATSSRLPSVEELMEMPREIQDLYSKSIEASRALASLEAAGAVHGGTASAFLTKNGIA